MLPPPPPPPSVLDQTADGFLGRRRPFLGGVVAGGRDTLALDSRALDGAAGDSPRERGELVFAGGVLLVGRGGGTGVLLGRGGGGGGGGTGALVSLVGATGRGGGGGTGALLGGLLCELDSLDRQDQPAGLPVDLGKNLALGRAALGRLLLLLLGLGTSALVDLFNAHLGLFLLLLALGASALVLLLVLGQAGGAELGETGRGGGAPPPMGALAAARSNGRVHLDREWESAACFDYSGWGIKGGDRLFTLNGASEGCEDVVVRRNVVVVVVVAVVVALGG